MGVLFQFGLKKWVFAYKKQTITNNCDTRVNPPYHISRLHCAQNTVHPVQTESLCWSQTEAEMTPKSWPAVFVCEGPVHYNKEVLEQSKLCYYALLIFKPITNIRF